MATVQRVRSFAFDLWTHTGGQKKVLVNGGFEAVQLSVRSPPRSDARCGRADPFRQRAIQLALTGTPLMTIVIITLVIT